MMRQPTPTIERSAETPATAITASGIEVPEWLIHERTTPQCPIGAAIDMLAAQIALFYLFAIVEGAKK